MTSRGIFFCTQPWGAEAQEWVSFVEGFITYTTIGLRGQVWVSFVAVGFIYFYVHDHRARRRRNGFLLLRIS